MMLRGGVLVVIAMGAAAGTARADALDKPAFTATPQELLAIAAAAPPGDWPSVVLREDLEISADEHGRLTYRVRVVGVIRTQDGADAWSRLSDGWYPAYQDKTRMRVRTIAPSGAVAEADPAQFDEFGDLPGYRGVAIELPALAIGTIIEYEATSRDHTAQLAAGGARILDLGNGVPTWSTRVRIAAPAARGAKVFAHDLPRGVAPIHTVERGREQWSYALGALAAVHAAEPAVASDATARPYIGVSTAASWSAVARAYHQQIERRIAAGPVALPAALPRTPTLATVRAIHAWLQRTAGDSGVGNIRGEVRATPAEVVRRGDGDSHELAVLLVALLRRAGLRADVAVLMTGPRRDVDPELPGIDRFDHAVVRVVVEGREVWICPIAGLTPAGTLPASEQGRRALIVADDTTALAVTPAAAPADNLVRQVRTFELGESDRATRVTEVTQTGGVFAPRLRAWIRDNPPGEVKEAVASYMKDEYVGELERYTTSDPLDLAAPFTLTMHAKRVERAFKARSQISVWLFPSDVFEQLPESVTAAEAPARRAAFEWIQPHVMEIENRLVVPTGYTIPDLPDDQTTQVGAGTLTERRRLDGRTLVVTFRFDSGKRRLTPDEFAALRRDAAAVRERTVEVIFEHIGWKLVDAGKPKQAIAEIERLIRLHPAEAQHHGELAYAYVQSGMGAAGRRAARRAVELEPKNADAYVVLAWVLSNDTLGRAYGPDHDRAGALAALATARALDPTHVGAAEDLGDLLARNHRGHRYAPGSDLSRAADALRAAFELDATEAHGIALATVLFRSGAHAEAERTLRALEASEKRDPLLVAVVAAGTGGAAAALALAGTLRAGDEKDALLEAAQEHLLSGRYYDVARRVRPATADVLQQRAARRTRAPALRDPARLPLERLWVYEDPERAAGAFWDAETARELATNADSPATALMIERGIIETFDDMMSSAIEIRTSGTAAAWRLDVTLPGETWKLYAALDGGVAKIVASGAHMKGLGRHALRLLARNELAAAAQCLDWALADATSQAKARELEGVALLWGPGLPRNRDAIELAAAALASGTAPARELAIGQRCSSTVSGAQLACDAMVAAALMNLKRWPELEAFASAFAARGADPQRVAMMRGMALLGQGRLDEAQRLCDASPGDPELARTRAWIAVQRGDVAEGVRRFNAVLTRGDAGATDRNNAAWLRLVAGTDLATARVFARQAVGDRAGTSPESLHTLAAIEAELGDLAAAKDAGWRSMLSGRRTMPAPHDWYVIGRIAEQLGLRDDAIAAYRRVKPAVGRLDDAASTHRLALRRLEQLGAR